MIGAAGYALECFYDYSGVPNEIPPEPDGRGSIRIALFGFLPNSASELEFGTNGLPATIPVYMLYAISFGSPDVDKKDEGVNRYGTKKGE